MIPFQITLVPSALPRLNNRASGYSQTSCHQNGGVSPHFHGLSAALMLEAGDKLLLSVRELEAGTPYSCQAMTSQRWSHDSC